jgi:uncharacterized membrane protein
MLYGHYTQKVNIMAAINRYVVFADWIFTAPSAVVQLVTGLWLVHLAGFPFTAFWVWGSIAGYTVAMFCWLPVVYWQIKMRNIAIEADLTQSELPAIYYRYFNYWFVLGWPAFISLVIVFYLMTSKPF